MDAGFVEILLENAYIYQTAKGFRFSDYFLQILYGIAFKKWDSNAILAMLTFLVLRPFEKGRKVGLPCLLIPLCVPVHVKHSTKQRNPWQTRQTYKYRQLGLVKLCLRGGCGHWPTPLHITIRL